MKRFFLSLSLLFPTAGFADADRFVASNTYATFYHELAHALIDILEIPIFGQEEDAADVLSVLMISEMWEEDRAVAMAYDAAFGFTLDPEDVDLEEVYFWGVHGPDPQRYYNLVCLFYGANPDERLDVAEELGLPEERIETCPEEWDQAAFSWGGILDELADSEEAGVLVLKGDDAEQIDILGEELEWLNEQFTYPQDIIVNVEACGEANAFYDLGTQEITMCSEYLPYLRELWTDASS
ncbi:MAG: DUF4344 domain-containing metallopeptidase [Pseudomonadota bacterium]